MQHEDGTQKEWKAYVDESKVNAFIPFRVGVPSLFFLFSTSCDGC